MRKRQSLFKRAWMGRRSARRPRVQRQHHCEPSHHHRGVFSLTRLAMQLAWFLGLPIRQASNKEYGLIYVPSMNWTMS
jgi:hypothetical protein